MTDRKKLANLIHEALIKAQATPGNISNNIAVYLIKNGVIFSEESEWGFPWSGSIAECKKCGIAIKSPDNYVPKTFNFCPRCGAKMIGNER